MTDYWISGDKSFYVTTFGGENSVLLDRVDFERTIAGVDFTPESRSETAPEPSGTGLPPNTPSTNP